MEDQMDGELDLSLEIKGLLRPSYMPPKCDSPD